MIERTTGWIQDPGSLENLIKVVELFNNNSNTHHTLIQRTIPRKISIADGRNEFLTELNSTDGHREHPKIKYKSLVGTAFQPRSSARCNGIIQALIPGQRRSFISDWPANNFLRWAETLNFIKHLSTNDEYTISDFGIDLSTASSIRDKFNIIKKSFLAYPPIIRVLELLYYEFTSNPTNPLLTKFELGKELGFRGEDGFTTYPQNIVIQEISICPQDKNEILSNWEGSSDKYARMICTWLLNDEIRWVEKIPKQISISINQNIYNTDIPQSYKITTDGIRAFKSARATSSNRRISKNVFFTMLATKGVDVNYLRTRRAFTIKYLSNWRTVENIENHLSSKGFTNIPINTIRDDIQNLSRIGLEVKSNSQNKFKIVDRINELEIPALASPMLIPSFITETKQRLSEIINNLDHSFFDLIDLGFDHRQNRIYELRIVELLNLIMKSSHLSGGNRIEIIAQYPSPNPIYAFMLDSKAYSNGFNLPNSERDKMIRYITEYYRKSETMNRNKWWENFKDPGYPSNEILFGFISGNFIGQYLNQLRYINQQTNKNGFAITSEALIIRIDKVLNTSINYSVIDFFNDLDCNTLVN